ncbi:MAG: helicase-related protein, partial [Verrucomicrobiaceae bacterium]
LAAMMQAVEAGHQAALMAPTQILAEQHYANARRWLEPLGIRVALRTGAKNIETVEMPDLNAELERTRPRVPQSAPSRIAPGETQDACYHRRRLPHFERPWAIYHFTTSTAKRRKLAPAERDIVLHHVIEAHNLRQIELLAACVMPDHLHILCEPQPKSQDKDGNPEFWSLSEIMSGIKSVSARRINKLSGISGSIWEKESFDTMVRGDNDLQGRFLYIVRNPREAELTDDNEVYQWLWTRDQEGEKGSANEQSAWARTAAREGACAPKLKNNEPQVLIGTHALLYEASAMPRLGIAVIDEQHKFGVAQRTRLIARGHAPHVLVMTATPIPRTLSLTLYGDLDVSTIDEKPSQRGGIVTSVRPQKKLGEITKFLLGEIEAGRQAYMVYPLIDESEKLKADAATLGFEEWTARLKPHSVGLLHGRMDAAVKDDVMRRFRAGEIKALVSTTVIEVGVDVPNSTVMVIFNAERFGLAQLHQLRGRVGRGEHESHCILLIPDKDEEASARLKILEETSDGFLIAEEDLRRRGPGDLLGSAQSGQAPLRFAELLGDTRLLTTARRLAERVLAADPELGKAEHAELRKLVTQDDAPVGTMQ